MCRLYLPETVNEIISLCFSNDDKISLEIQSTSDFQLINLQSLTFQYVFSSDQMTEIINTLNNYPNLTYLNFFDCYCQFDDNILDQIWSLSKLKYLYISSITCQRDVSINLSIHSSTIKSLSIQKIFLNKHSLNNLFQFTPYIQYLNISTEQNDDCVNIQYLPYLIKLKLFANEESSNNRFIDGDRLTNLLQVMPNLYYLSVEISYTFLDGRKWEYLITNYLSKLKISNMIILFNGYNYVYHRQLE